MKTLKKLLSPYSNLPREVYIIFISRIINALGCFVMPLLTIILTERIGLSEKAAGLYISLSGVLFIPASFLGGKLADTIGRKKVIILFDALAILLYAACGFIPPSMPLVYTIMLAGMFMGAAGPAHDSLIADLTTPANRGGAYSLIYMGWNIGFALGPVLGGLLYKNHLPLIFIGDAATALISLCLVLFFIKETLGKTKEDISDKNRVMEKREEGSILAVLLRRPILISFALIVFGYNFAYSQWSFMMPMHVIQNFGESGAKYYGFLAGFNGLVVMLTTPLITKMIERVKDMRRAVYGGLLYTAGFGMLGIWNTLPFFFLSVFIFTLGEIVLSISVTPFIANNTPISHRGRMSAVMPTLMGLGYTLGPVGMGLVLTYIKIETGWLIIGAIVSVFSILMYRLEKCDKGRPTNQGEKEEAEVPGDGYLV